MGMISGLTSPSRSWFALEITPAAAREVPGAREWTHSVKERLEEAFAGSNIYAALHGFYQEIAVFGTAAMLLEEDGKELLRARLFTAGEYVLGCDENGRIDRFGREFFLTPNQMAAKFGLENLPPQLLRAVQDGKDTSWHRVRHLILPNHTANSIDALKILSENFGDSILVSLMGQYIPWGRAKEYPKLSRKITKREYDKVADCMFSLDLDGYMQELSSADDSYIPKWDLADEV